MKPRRSNLSVPGHLQKMHVKAQDSQADVIMLDLEDSVPLDYAALPETILIEKETASALRAELTLPEELEAPVEKGRTVGKVSIFQDDTLLNEYEVKAAADAPLLTFGGALELLWQCLLGA